MSAETQSTVPGIVRNGVVVPQIDSSLPEGAHVETLLKPHEMSPELRNEIAAWDKASDEAWSLIDRLESESE